MNYEKCLELAGAKVIVSKYFGSYQGDWWAKVKYQGKTFWTHGSFGSCSSCDAFKAEFGYKFDHDDENGNRHWYVNDFIKNKETCKLCANAVSKMADFGNQYLDNGYTQEEAVTDASKNLGWDMEADEMVQFIKDND